MKKKIKAIFAVITAALCIFAFAGCGSSFDAPGMLKACLDAYTTGEISQELVDMSEESEEEIQKEIDDTMEEMAEACLIGMDEDYLTDESKAQALEMSKNIMKNLKYEISDECEVKDGTYYVKVNAYPMEAINGMEEFLGGEFTEEWLAKAESYSDLDAFYADFYPAAVKAISDYFADEANYTYGDPEELTVKISENKDGYYEPDEDDIEDLFTVLAGEE